MSKTQVGGAEAWIVALHLAARAEIAILRPGCL